MSFLRIFSLLVLLTCAGLVSAAPRVLIVSPEQSGLYQTGGLAHATTGLAVGMNKSGVSTEVLMPYFTHLEGSAPQDTGERISVALDWRGGHRAHKRSDFAVYKLDRPLNPTLFLRHETHPDQVNYFDTRGRGYGPDPTLGESFGAFDRAAADFILSRNYDIVFLNDWTTGLIALHLWDAKLRGEKVPKVVFAIHNIAYQGNYPESLAEFLGIDARHYTKDGYEFYGRMSFLKAGMMYSDVTYTVSRQYSKEIATPRFGAGLDGVVSLLKRHNRIFGFLNGIDEADWSPSRQVDELPYTFSADSLEGKALGKIHLQQQLGLPIEPAKPVFILTSRLAEQKGYAYLPRAIELVAGRGDSQWVVTGDGEPGYVEAMRELESRFPQQVRYRPFSAALERLLTRYGDFAVNAAWFEPSGLNQFFAMKNGTIPLVSAVGGLVDSVRRGVTGFLFDIAPGTGEAAYDVEKSARNVARAARAAIDFYSDADRLHAMRIAGMTESHSWERRVREDFMPFFDSMLLGGPADCREDLLP